MAIIEVDVATKEPREFRGRKQYGVKPVGKDYWITLEVDFRPTKGMRFDVQMKETEKDGKTYRNATIIGPAPDKPGSVTEQFQAEKQAGRVSDAEYQRYTAQREAGAPDNTKPLAVPPSPPSGPSGPLNPPSGKIKWEEWTFIAGMAWDFAVNSCTMPSAEAVAFVSTTLIALSNGKLELPQPPIVNADGTGNKSEDDIPW